MATKHTDNGDYPTGWHAGGGEASRPLHEGGRYMHNYYRKLGGSNQYEEKFLELRVDTSGGGPPSQHHAELRYCTEDGVEVTEKMLLESATVDVTDPADPGAQERAEGEIRDIAEGWMEKYATTTVGGLYRV